MLSSEFDLEKNKSKTPADYFAYSNKKVWWKCKKEHSWLASICNRSGGTGCPYCKGLLPIEGETDLLTVNPMLASEFDLDKNNGMTAADFLPNSDKKVWWICAEGHSWQTAVKNRTKGHGCPYCSGQWPIIGINDMKTVNPNLAEEFDTEKNNGKMPSDYMPSSGARVWWKCVNGHSWQARIADRTKGTGCPYCSNMRVLKGYNDLAVTSPQLAQEFDNKLNGKKRAYDFTEGSGDIVWWKCVYGHSWKARVSDRKKGRNCPYCAGRLPIVGKTDLMKKNPRLAMEFDEKKNDGKKASEYTFRSNKKVWWKCGYGHEWMASVNSRTSGNGCPYCAGKIPVKGENDLETLIPYLAEEFDREKNVGKSANDYSVSSAFMVWWKCSNGHRWQARIADRKRGKGCPYCSGRNPIIEENDLKSVNPQLASEFDEEKNGGKKACEYLPRSGKKVWWICSKGHSWQACVYRRSSGAGCPICSRKNVKK